VGARRRRPRRYAPQLAACRGAQDGGVFRAIAARSLRGRPHAAPPASRRGDPRTEPAGSRPRGRRRMDATLRVRVQRGRSAGRPAVQGGARDGAAGAGCGAAPA
jgi:hypothetical protein